MGNETFYGDGHSGEPIEHFCCFTNFSSLKLNIMAPKINRIYQVLMFLVTLWVASKKSHAEVGLARWQSQATVTWHLKNFGLTSAKRA